MRKEYVPEEKKIAASQFVKEKEYWSNKFSGELSFTHFPYDTAAVEQGEAKSIGEAAMELDRNVTAQLEKLTKGNAAKLHMVLLAALTILLHKYTGSTDIVVATPIDKQEIDGEFTNTVLALRSKINRPATFKEQLLQVRQTIIEALENQNYPIEALQDQVGRELFDIALLLENIHDEKYLDRIAPKITYIFGRTEERINARVKYDARYYEKATIENINRLYQFVLEQALPAPDIDIAEISLLTEEEEKSYLYDFNETAASYPRDRTVIHLFRAQAAQTPDKTAVIEAGTGHTLTYRELDRHSDAVAAHLASLGVGVGHIVGIMMDRSIRLLEGIQGILKAGAAYLPLEPGLPPERIRYMLTDSNATLLLTEPGNNTAGELNDIVQLVIEPPHGDAFHPAEANTAGPTDTAYVIYTSGSTGKPKGTVIHHRGLMNYIWWAAANYIKDQGDNFPLYTSIAFDLTVTSIFAPLVTGRAVVVFRDEDKETLIEKVVQDPRVGVVKLTPSHLKLIREQNRREMSPTAGNGTKRFILGGEDLETALAADITQQYRSIGRDIEIYNEYGPTETVVGCMIHKYDENEDRKATVSIGKPAANARIYILDNDLKPVPQGVTGELYIGGHGVAKGYMNNTALTEERFVPDPTNPGQKMYRSGDHAARLSDGKIYYRGRTDHQVKIRGYRIETGEIQAKLQEQDEIGDAYVIDGNHNDGTKYLCAYIAPKNRQDIDTIPPADIRNKLAKDLPDYMIPDYIVLLPEIPLTINGKVDRKALPHPSTAQQGEYTAPRNTAEQKLAEIWAEVLELKPENIGIDNSYFEIGGHSLNATTLVSKIHKAFDVRLTLVDIFRTPTIRGLAELIEQSEETKFEPLVKAEVKEHYALSSAQKRLFILQYMEPQAVVYNVHTVLATPADVKIEQLEQAFNKLIQRHECLRTTFKMHNDEPVQQIQPEAPFKIRQYDAGNTEPTNIINGFVRPFDLSKPPLIRAGLITVDAPYKLLIFDMHHIVTDGVTQNILVRDYRALFEGKELPPLTLQYKDYSEWQSRSKTTGALKQQQEYWKKEFEDDIPVLNMPTDTPRPPVADYRGRNVAFQFDRQVTAGLNRLAKKHGATLFSVLLGVYDIFLHKMSGQEDIVVGVTTANRNHADLEGIVGIFINTPPIRIKSIPENTVSEFIEQVKEKSLQTLKNQNYAFEDIVEDVVKNRDVSRNPLYDVMFNLHNMVEPNTPPSTQKTPAEDGEKQIFPYTIEHRTSKFDLNWQSTEQNGELISTIEYKTSLYNEQTVYRYIGYIKNIAAAISQHADTRLADLEYMTTEERNRLVYELNDNPAEYSKDKTVHRLFEEQVEKTPENIAVEGIPAGTPALERHITTLTYRELNRRANRLARELRKRGVTPNTFVGVVIDRSVEMVIGVMAIIKSGAAYVPLEPYLPDERIRVCLASLNVKWLITNRNQIEKVAPIGAQLPDLQHIICLDAQKDDQLPENMKPAAQYIRPEEIDTNNDENPNPVNRPTDIAYVIFTSGTTGNPKGVIEEHRPVINIIEWVNKSFGVNPADKLLFIASISFDLSVYDIFGMLAAGGTIRTATAAEIKAPGHLLKIIREEGITIWDSAPAALQQLAPDIQALNNTDHQPDKSIFRLVLLSGDWIPVTLPDILKEAFTGINVIALGGATEATIWSNNYPIGKVDPQWPSIPYGKPTQNARYYVLDRHLKPCATRVPGDLFIGGQCLAAGYINEVELTANKFIDNPFIPGEKMYRTGDRARFYPDGNIEFLGRVDNQVKIRGYRVELGEIQGKLNNHDHIKETIVLARESNTKEKYLCAYIVFKEIWEVEGSVNVNQLREYLSTQLPDYMIPAHFIEIEKIPLTANGKVDRKTLDKMGRHLETGVDFEAPSNNIETTISEIWNEVLNQDGIGINDNFFDLGGNSLNIVGVGDKLSNILGKKIPVAKMFVYPTIQTLAQYVITELKPGDIAGNQLHETADTDMEDTMNDTINAGIDDSAEMLEDSMDLLNIADTAMIGFNDEDEDEDDEY